MAERKTHENLQPCTHDLCRGSKNLVDPRYWRSTHTRNASAYGGPHSGGHVSEEEMERGKKNVIYASVVLFCATVGLKLCTTHRHRTWRFQIFETQNMAKMGTGGGGGG